MPFKTIWVPLCGLYLLGSSSQGINQWSTGGGNCELAAKVTTRGCWERAPAFLRVKSGEGCRVGSAGKSLRTQVPRIL